MTTAADSFASGDSLDIASLLARYEVGLDPADVIAAVLERIEEYPDRAVWIERFSPCEIRTQLAAAIERKRSGIPQPLLGIPFAVKDNIDVAGLPTTAGCPAYTRMPAKSATVVQKLTDAGAIVIGKTNLDQFAT